MKSFVRTSSWLHRTLFVVCGFFMALFIYAETTIGYLIMFGLVALMVRDDWTRWRRGQRAGRS